MDGQKHAHRAAWYLAAVLAAGCGEVPSLPPAADAPTVPVTHFDPTTAGTLQGRVTWDGALPVVPPFDVPVNPLGNEVFQRPHSRPNPLAPVIDGRSRGVGDAVVFLRGVDSQAARAWDHPPALVELRDCQFTVCQGEPGSRVGFVRRGDSVTLTSRDNAYHSVHAGGAAFFTLTFPDRDQPRMRPLAEKGLVELTSAAGYFWMRAYLFVDDHPYYTRTDAEGRFTLSQVPPGKYEVVCWLPNWLPERHERDPESAGIARLYFQPPVEWTQTVTLGPGESRGLAFSLSTHHFQPEPAGSEPVNGGSDIPPPHGAR
jgi:hypothetical protein